MDKIYAIFKISLQQELNYKLQFIFNRLRNIIQILVFFFLWQSAFTGQENLFGYTEATIGTYAFLLIVVRSLVMLTKVNDVSGYVSSGELSNYLLRPFDFMRYVVIRDIPIKLINFVFSVFEIALLVVILKPNLFLQTDIFQIFLFITSLLIASLLFFYILMITNAVPFWMPEAGWGAQFLVMVIFIEFFSGAFFPIDVFPKFIQELLLLTPFPHVIFIPIKSYLGDLSMMENIRHLLVGFVWIVILFIVNKKVWNRGLAVYEGVGR